MNSVFIVMSIATNIITNGALLGLTDMKPVHRFDDMRYERLDVGCSSFVNEALTFCYGKELSPVGIGICTKGEVKEGTITLQHKTTPYPIKLVLEAQFAIPVAILNRFQAFSFGAFEQLGHDVSHSADSLGIINLSNGVGCGVIKKGQLIQEYDPNVGMGGLQKVKRLSDDKPMTIAQIAGVESLQEQARYSRTNAEKLFEYAVNERTYNSSVFINDVANAIALLAENTTKKYGVLDFYVSVYDKYNISQNDKQKFVEIVKAEIPKISTLPINLNLLTLGLKEEDVKTFGIGKFASMVCSQAKTKYVPFNNVFVVTGLPSSGKSTFMQKLLTQMQKEGRKVGGIITNEVRGRDHRRSGFVAVSHSTRSTHQSCEIATLKANVPYNSRGNYLPFKNTQYMVNVANIDRFVIPNLQKACIDEDVVIIDEVAGMQLFCNNFQKMVFSIFLNLQKPVIFTVPEASNEPLINQIKEKARAIVTLDPKNREGSQQNGFNVLLPELIQTPPISISNKECS
jgi:nucleoside-triphosphatase